MTNSPPARPVRICLVCGEIFAWNKYGGFGRSARWIGRDLVRRGYEVHAVVPRRKGQRPVEQLDGMTVWSFPLYNPLASLWLYRRCRAQIYHSQQPSLGTALARIAMPRSRHVVTCRDIKLSRDWRIEQALPSRSRLAARLTRLYEDNPLVGWAVRNADRVFSAYQGVGRKARVKFRLPVEPGFLPSPVEVPVTVRKSATPQVCYVGRWDRRKRPHLFFELARAFPEVRFVAVGLSQDKAWEASLRDTYGGLPNLELRGFVNQFDGTLLSGLYEESWILVNTSPREGLPTSFLEAAAHRCAIRACVNPDGFTAQSGWHASAKTLSTGLAHLLEADRWRSCGERAYQLVRDSYESERAMDLHCALYRELLEGDGNGRRS